MWRAVRRVPEFLRASDEQMRRDQDLIRRKNLGTLKSVCLVYTLLLLAYAVTALFLFDSIPLRVLYGIFVAAQLAFDFSASGPARRHTDGSRPCAPSCPC